MSEPFIGEIRAFPYANLCPEGWFYCNGATYSIQQFTPLFSILGTRFGGDGKTTFKVPNLSGVVPVNAGLPSNNRGNNTIGFGITTGSNTASANYPVHTHNVLKHPPKTAGTAQKVATPSLTTELAQFSDAAGSTNYNSFAANTAFNTNLSLNSLSAYAGGGQPHENRQPFVSMYYFIAWNGIYPVKS